MSDLFTSVLDASRARRALIIRGSNVSDLVLGPEGFIYIRELVALAHASEGRVAVTCSSEGTRQDPVPGQPPVALHLPPADASPGQALRTLREGLVGLQDGVVVILDFADLYLPTSLASTQPSPDQQMLIEQMSRFPVDATLAAHRLVVIARADDLDRRIARFPGWEVITIEPPEEEMRVRFAHRLAMRGEANPGDVAPLEEGFTPEELGRNTGGLTLDEIYRAAGAAAERGERLTREWVQTTKVSRLRHRAVDGLEIYAPGFSIDRVAGLPQIRLLIKERTKIGSWPRCILLVGPPGVGKTLVVRAIADALGWPAVAWGNTRSPWVGETERNTRALLAVTKAMAPLVMHLDEADQLLGARDVGQHGDSGTSGRVVAAVWTHLGAPVDDGSPDVFVLTSNRVDLCDSPTLSRAEVIPIIHPTPSEAVDLLCLACEQQRTPIAHDVASAALASAKVGVVSGRMLVKVAQRALVCAGQRGAAAIDRTDLDLALRQLRERVDPIEDERQALKAIEMTTFDAYLPWVAAQTLGQPVEYLPYVEPLMTAGELDRDRLAARISELDELALRRRARRS